tara:strand:- start:242 stop:457 length:216 start_codon:yes stop_codon:yes gene_type:complete
MRKDHQELIERWANFVKKNPAKWKKTHTEFINSLFDKHEQFKERLLKSPGGKKKLIKLYSIGNKSDYDFLK